MSPLVAEQVVQAVGEQTRQLAVQAVQAPALRRYEVAHAVQAVLEVQVVQPREQDWQRE